MVDTFFGRFSLLPISTIALLLFVNFSPIFGQHFFRGYQPPPNPPLVDEYSPFISPFQGSPSPRPSWPPAISPPPLPPSNPLSSLAFRPQVPASNGEPLLVNTLIQVFAPSQISDGRPAISLAEARTLTAVSGGAQSTPNLGEGRLNGQKRVMLSRQLDTQKKTFIPEAAVNPAASPREIAFVKAFAATNSTRMTEAELKDELAKELDQSVPLILEELERVGEAKTITKGPNGPSRGDVEGLISEGLAELEESTIRMEIGQGEGQPSPSFRFETTEGATQIGDGEEGGQMETTKPLLVFTKNHRHETPAEGEEEIYTEGETITANGQGNGAEGATTANGQGNGAEGATTANGQGNGAEGATTANGQGNGAEGATTPKFVAETLANEKGEGGQQGEQPNGEGGMSIGEMSTIMGENGENTASTGMWTNSATESVGEAKTRINEGESRGVEMGTTIGMEEARMGSPGGIGSSTQGNGPPEKEFAEEGRVSTEMGGEERRTTIGTTDIGGMSPSGAEIGGTSPSGAEIGGTSPSGAEIGGTSPSGAEIGGTSPSGAEIGGTSPSGAEIGGTSPSGAEIGGTSPSGAEIGGTSPSGAEIGGTSPSGAEIGGTSPSGAEIGGTSPSGAEIGGTSGSSWSTTNEQQSTAEGGSSTEGPPFQTSIDLGMAGAAETTERTTFGGESTISGGMESSANQFGGSSTTTAIGDGGEEGEGWERTEFEEGQLWVRCRPPGIQARLRASPNRTLGGVLFAKDFHDQPGCFSELGEEGAEARLEIGQGQCGLATAESAAPSDGAPPGQNASLVLVFAPRRSIILGSPEFSFLLQCFSPALPSQQHLTANLDIRPPAAAPVLAKTIELEQTPPKCEYSLRRDSPNGPLLESVDLGQTIFHRWECRGGAEAAQQFGIFLSDCLVANSSRQTNESTPQPTIELIDSQGCSTDSAIFGDPEYAEGALLATARAKAFSLRPEAHSLQFSCQLRICSRQNGGCQGLTPPQCPANSSAHLALALSRRHLLHDHSPSIAPLRQRILSTQISVVPSHSHSSSSSSPPSPRLPFHGSPIQRNLLHSGWTVGLILGAAILLGTLLGIISFLLHSRHQRAQRARLVQWVLARPPASSDSAGCSENGGDSFYDLAPCPEEVLSRLNSPTTEGGEGNGDKEQQTEGQKRPRNVGEGAKERMESRGDPEGE